MNLMLKRHLAQTAMVIIRCSQEGGPRLLVDGDKQATTLKDALITSEACGQKAHNSLKALDLSDSRPFYLVLAILLLY